MPSLDSSKRNNNDIPILKDVFPPVFFRLKPAAVLKAAPASNGSLVIYICGPVFTKIEDLDLSPI